MADERIPRRRDDSVIKGELTIMVSSEERIRKEDLLDALSTYFAGLSVEVKPGLRMRVPVFTLVVASHSDE